ncbi:unnamed protein product [Brachionus calyciflorus]|uniref:Uncharacterized protein n=1 Tax=Brachionus calyciflorus TaxID=104777 RepID=A0A814PQR2_9BILA|nr:unnamed protein product [Brachionus calyciflorus]
MTFEIFTRFFFLICLIKHSISIIKEESDLEFFIRLSLTKQDNVESGILNTDCDFISLFTLNFLNDFNKNDYNFTVDYGVYNQNEVTTFNPLYISLNLNDVMKIASSMNDLKTYLLFKWDSFENKFSFIGRFHFCFIFTDLCEDYKYEDLKSIDIWLSFDQKDHLSCRWLKDYIKYDFDEVNDRIVIQNHNFEFLNAYLRIFNYSDSRFTDLPIENNTIDLRKHQNIFGKTFKCFFFGYLEPSQFIGQNYTIAIDIGKTSNLLK